MQENINNRTIFCHDNLEIMQGMNSESIDLIYLDPPFNKNKEFTAPIGTSAEGAHFKDYFREEDVKQEWLQTIKEDNSELYNFLNGIKAISSNAYYLYNFCYLTYMAIRLIEMKRILKPEGSIYLHCDATMVHYLKLLMDIIFTEKNFKNNLVWRRATAHNDNKKYGNITDFILFYSKTEKFFWNGKEIATPKSLEDLQKSYRLKDERGNYRSENLTGTLHTTSKEAPSTQPWKNYDVYAMGRCWSVPTTGDYARYIDTYLLQGYAQIDGIHHRLDALDKAGLIIHPKKGKWPGLKRYAQADQGVLPQNLILQPTGFTNFTTGKEYVGYPTQKPLALLEKIMQASSNEGNVILDPFCGCATTCVAAEKLNRQWIGIDISVKAYELVQSRLATKIEQEGTLFHEELVTFQTAPPKRTDKDANWQEKKYVYIISHQQYQNEYKVGIASNVQQRLNNYQTGDPNRDYQLEYSFHTPYFREIEKHIHNKYPNKHEWVAGNLQDIKMDIENYKVSDATR